MGCRRAKKNIPSLQEHLEIKILLLWMIHKGNKICKDNLMDSKCVGLIIQKQIALTM